MAAAPSLGITSISRASQLCRRPAPSGKSAWKDCTIREGYSIRAVCTILGVEHSLMVRTECIGGRKGFCAESSARKNGVSDK